MASIKDLSKEPLPAPPWDELYRVLPEFISGRTADPEAISFVSGRTADPEAISFVSGRTADPGLRLVKGLVRTHAEQDRILSTFHIHPLTRMSSDYRAALKQFGSAKAALRELAGPDLQRMRLQDIQALRGPAIGPNRQLMRLQDIQATIVNARKRLMATSMPTLVTESIFEFELGTVAIASGDDAASAWSIKAAVNHRDRLLDNLGVEASSSYSFDWRYDWKAPETINEDFKRGWLAGQLINAGLNVATQRVVAGRAKQAAVAYQPIATAIGWLEVVQYTRDNGQL